MQKVVLGTNIETCIIWRSLLSYEWMFASDIEKVEVRKKVKCIYSSKTPTDAIVWGLEHHWSSEKLFFTGKHGTFVTTMGQHILCFHALLLQTFYRCFWPSFLVLAQLSYSHFFFFFSIYTKRESSSALPFHLQYRVKKGTYPL